MGEPNASVMDWSVYSKDIKKRQGGRHLATRNRICIMKYGGGRLLY